MIEDPRDLDPSKEVLMHIIRPVVSFAVLVAALIPGTSQAVRRTVPSPYPTIQSAINASNNTDTVLVSPNRIYTENVDLGIKEITVASHYITIGDTSMISRTVIDGGRAASVVTIPGVHTGNTRLIGFTIRNGVGSGTGSSATGGGITCTSEETEISTPYIAHCVVEDDSSRYGGGVCCYFSSPTLENCIIRDNLASLDGGGFHGKYNGNAYHGAIFRNCIITGNWAKEDGGGLSAQDHALRMYNCIVEMNETEDEQNGDGGGIFCDNCSGPFVNTVLTDNYADDDGGGLYITSYDYPILTNSIVWDNDCEGSGLQIYVSTTSIVNLRCSDVDTTMEGIHGDYNWGPGCICQEPSFYDDVYHLDEDSPCIDAGNDSTRYHDPPNPTYPDSARPPSWGLVRNDMGAHGGPLTANWNEQMIQVDPLFLDFGMVPVDEESTMIFLVGNEGWRDLIVYDIPSSNPFFEMENDVPFEVMEADEEEVSVTFIPQSIGPQDGLLTVKSNDRWQTVTVSGYGSGPLLAVDPDTLDFAAVVVGTEVVDTFYISNVGTETLEVEELLWDNPVFEVEDDTPFPVAPGGTEPIEVIFAPIEIQPEETVVEVVTDAGDDHLVLRGEGAPLTAIQHLWTMLIRPHLFLKWEPIQGATHYRIYRHTEPLFIPSPGDSLAMTTAWSFVDSGATGNPAVNYYYLIFAANELTVSPPSSRVGEFDRNLVNNALLAKSGRPIWER
jgi:hypothetical protein